jgi:hypothetical protein
MGSFVVWLWNKGYVVEIMDFFWILMTKLMRSKKWYGNLMNKMCEIQKEGFKQDKIYGFMGVFLTLK